MFRDFGLHSFRNKLILSFTSLTILTVGVIVLLVNTRLQQASEDKIEEDTRITLNVLKQFRQTQLQNSSDATAALIRNNPQLRASLAEFNEEELFEEGLNQEEQYQVLEDIVSDIQLFQESQIFIITDGQGVVLYQKASRALIKKDISQWPVIQTALNGDELFSWWGKGSPLYMDVPQANQRQHTPLYEVFFKPVTFGDNVVGLLIIGFDTSNQPSLIKTITLSDIAFFQNRHLYSSSAPPHLNSALENLASDIQAKEPRLIYPFEYAGEDFLALAHPVLNGLQDIVGTIVIFRSKTHELSFFEDLSNRLNGIGALAVFGGLIFALIIGRGVSHSVNILSKGAEEIANGNLDIVLPITSQDELGELTKTFNKMTTGLKEKEHITKTFKKYVASSVVDEVLKNKIELGGEKKEITIYFTDLANFTALSEKLTPEDLISFLNQYLSEMTQIIEDNSGIVDKYIGDAIMAFWGAPLDVPDHPHKACTVALQHKAWHKGFSQKWQDHPLISTITTRFGIHTGEVIVGNVGSERRWDYTIIGDSVNLASRLESLNKYYGTTILITEATHHALAEDLLTREIDLVQVKGKDKAIRIYELMAFTQEASSSQKMLSELFSQGRKEYLNRNFKNALQLFHLCQEKAASDQPTQIMIKRCQELLEIPPDDAWQGIQVMIQK
ncbi:MAG: HAMP domain-containing protein [SAR324 cluster bacterium]|nr:HAMP domain-containing protein [SAR324 cluster bacterium]